MKLLLSIIAFLFSFTSSYSQDVILLATGEDMEVRIVEVNSEVIRYKKFDNLDGPIFNMLRTDAWMIRYENGPKVILKPEAQNDSSKIGSHENAFNRGQTDALKYYDGYKSAGTGTLVTSIVSPALGLIPAILCSTTKPAENSLNYPNASLMKNNEYRTGYMITAKKTKSGKVWKNWTIALGINLFLVLLITSGN